MLVIVNNSNEYIAVDEGGKYYYQGREDLAVKFRTIQECMSVIHNDAPCIDMSDVNIVEL